MVDLAASADHPTFRADLYAESEGTEGVASELDGAHFGDVGFFRTLEMTSTAVLLAGQR
ncbi:MAG: hypothetical protein ACR2NZ_10925 [Rubripirellula sp.]